MSLNEFLEKLRNQPPPSGPKCLGFFILATVCAAPFIFGLAFMAVARFTGKEVLSGPEGMSVFMLPFLLGATVCEIIFIPFYLDKRPSELQTVFTSIYFRHFSVLVYAHKHAHKHWAVVIYAINPSGSRNLEPKSWCQPSFCLELAGFVWA